MKLRAMHVKPDGVSRVWDIILADNRQNARIHMNPEGTEFMDIIILEQEGWTKKDYPALSQLNAENTNTFNGTGDLLESKDNILRI